jgi:antitoxin VapB
MNAPVHTKTFKSGNSVAVRLPKAFAIPADQPVIIEKNGDIVTLRAAHDPALEKRRMEVLFRDLAKIGAPLDGVQPREPFEFPERECL